MDLIKLLTIVRDHCALHGEIDAVTLAHAAACPLDEVCAAIERMEAEGLALVEEYGFSCSVEYSVTGLTEAGLARLL